METTGRFTFVRRLQVSVSVLFQKDLYNYCEPMGCEQSDQKRMDAPGSYLQPFLFDIPAEDTLLFYHFKAESA